jgi:hypothetical protein
VEIRSLGHLARKNFEGGNIDQVITRSSIGRHRKVCRGKLPSFRQSAGRFTLREYLLSDFLVLSEVLRPNPQWTI